MITITEITRRRDAIRAGNTRTLQEMASDHPEFALTPSQMLAAEMLLLEQAQAYDGLVMRAALAQMFWREPDAIFDSGRRAA